MLYVDRHEDPEMVRLLGQCVDAVEVADLNPTMADIWYLSADGKSISWENKQAGELLGGLDDVEEQLTREMVGVDYLGLTVRGIITPTIDGYCQTWTHPKDKKTGRILEHLYTKNKVYRTYYKGYAAFTERLERCGVVVKEAADLKGLVLLLAASYEAAQKPDYQHKTFKRLIVTKQWLAELDPDKARFAKQLMGCVPGVGEEIALTLADYFPSLKTLMDTLEGGGEGKVASLRLRGGRRSIGPSVVRKMQEALGITR